MAIPDMSGHVKESVSWTSGGVTYLTYMYAPYRATRGPHSFQRWYTCQICGFDFPASEIVHVGGAPYCTRYQHATEAMIRRDRNH